MNPSLSKWWSWPCQRYERKEMLLWYCPQLALSGGGRSGWYWDDWQFPVSCRHIDISTGLSWPFTPFPDLQRSTITAGEIATISNRNVLSYSDSQDGEINDQWSPSLYYRGDVGFLFSFISPPVCKSFYKENGTLKNIAWIIPMKIIIRYNAFAHYTNILSDPISTYNSF